MTGSNFKQQSLRQRRTIGEQLVYARETRGRSIEEIAEKLKISVQHLEALEHGRYNDLPSPVYIKNYLKLYAKECGISWDRIEEQYEQEVHVYHNPELPLRKKPTVQQAAKHRKKKRINRLSTGGAHRKALEIPQLVKIGAGAVIALLVILYFVWGLVSFFSPPELVLIYPTEDIRVTERLLIVEGYSEPESTVTINGQTVALGTDGTFSEEVYLHEGVNTLQVSTRTRRSKERLIEKHVLYIPATDDVIINNQENNLEQ